MAERYLDRRIGETRGALVEGGRLVAMQLARDGDGVSAGSRHAARLIRKLGPRGIAVIGAEEVLVEPWPPGACEGATLSVEIVRSRWPEPGRPRLAKARPAGPQTRVRPAAQPLAEAVGDGFPHPVAEAWEAGWEAATLGQWPFPGGTLLFQPTAAFVAVDVDGTGRDLAPAAAAALAQAIRLWDLGGGIVVDFPLSGRAGARQAIAAAFDTAIGELAHERTAVNGFGLMQVIRPRAGPSILERARFERDATLALGLIAAATRETRPGDLRLVAPPAAAGWLLARPHLLAALARATGRRVDVVADPVASGGHVETRAR